MHENNTENILCSRIDYTMLSLISSKINVLIVGGGKAALIKAKTFIKSSCKVCIVAKEFIPEFKQFIHCTNLELIIDKYNKNYIFDKHLIVIATNCEVVNKSIRKDCEELYKLYIECTTPRDGVCITPCQRSTQSIFFGLHTVGGNPKMSVFLADKMKGSLEKYDGFVEFTSIIRNKVKNLKNKQEILNFICSDDFYFFYEKGKARAILKLFYRELIK